eukprot:CAMPEP_0173061172 /NCGR_PEP_ID=MMETSP1102-20130122/3055_1 /TAXON_ID=49646 /ORGANISM="Geminigera sp., Strain Caron Lab Isolate" /LENGTH=48 /DNA_ID= /DNA_START= /DNA_END= /DNA_ORIENTATION=
MSGDQEMLLHQHAPQRSLGSWLIVYVFFGAQMRKKPTPYNCSVEKDED